MRRLREVLEDIQVLCWNATEDEFEKKVQEYLRAYPHLRNPATIDLVRQAVKTWFRIKKLEEILNQTKDPKEQATLIFRIDRLQRTWMAMLGNLAIAYTRQQYKKKKTVVQPPIERLKMLNPKKEKNTK